MNFAFHWEMKFRKIIQVTRQFLWAILMEGVGTTRMMHVYARHGSGKLKLTPAHWRPTEEELQVAGEQLKDIPRSLLFIAVFFIPLPGFVGGYALLAIMIERWLGNKIKLLPTRFRPLLVPAVKK